jgi:hypothetical protein
MKIFGRIMATGEVSFRDVGARFSVNDQETSHGGLEERNF